MKLEDAIKRGTRAGQPAANSVPVGTLYAVTDEVNIVERSSGAAWEAYSPPIPIALATQVSGDLPYANLAQGAALSVLGVTGNATADVASIAAAAAQQVLQRIDNTLVFSNINVQQTIRKPSDETVTSSTALQDDNDFTMAIAANEIWVYEFWLFVISASSTPQIKYQIATPAGATIKAAQDGVLFSVAATSGDVDRFSNPSASEPAPYVGSTGGGGNAQLIYFPVVVVNGANAGNVKLQWAQNVSNGSGTVVQANSLMMGRRIA